MVISSRIEDKILKYCINLILLITFAITAIPLLNLLAVSLSNPDSIMRGKVLLWPVGLTFEPYKYVLSSKQFVNSFGISVIIAVLGSMLGIFMSVAAAYPLSKKTLPGRRLLVLAFIFTIMFSGGLIPSYILVRNLHMLNSIWSLVLPSMINVFYVLIAKSYFEGIPVDIEESAKIDGASYIQTLIRIMIPIAVPLMAVLLLFFAVDYWNEYINARMYITKLSKMPLQLYLRMAIFESNDASRNMELDSNQMEYLSSNNIANALICSAILPVLISYPFAQKYFVTGITVGSVKG